MWACKSFESLWHPYNRDCIAAHPFTRGHNEQSQRLSVNWTVGLDARSCMFHVVTPGIFGQNWTLIRYMDHPLYKKLSVTKSSSKLWSELCLSAKVWFRCLYKTHQGNQGTLRHYVSFNTFPVTSSDCTNSVQTRMSWMISSLSLSLLSLKQQPTILKVTLFKNVGQLSDWIVLWVKGFFKLPQGWIWLLKLSVEMKHKNTYQHLSIASSWQIRLALLECSWLGMAGQKVMNLQCELHTRRAAVGLINVSSFWAVTVETQAIGHTVRRTKLWTETWEMRSLAGKPVLSLETKHRKHLQETVTSHFSHALKIIVLGILK